ncbi:restriction endonuclease [Alicyclobacillus cycloheptanicus]|uniref:Restriction system protein n=1 Tax=Alicyclobacillus cycloheptanicus TaxID=1457 RepID=A0ABT9XMR9_9BACL|nr:restriction endonuclease [Alicyclobacillus cycloheptanicus]MDQ0191618.1 restriction system protein [Alicyclobacillus cycloheptanicus]
MARRKKNDTFELLWQGLVVLPALLGFAIGFELSHSVGIAGAIAGAGAGIGIGILVIRKLSLDEKLKRSGIRDIDKMDGRQFEHYLGHLFKSQGYNVQVTRASGDFGADLVLQKDGKVIVVQAKRHSKNIGIKAVQEAQASIAHYKAHEAWVVSNRDYTEEAKSLAKSNGVRLVNRNDLVEMILRMNSGSVPNPNQVMTSMQQEEMKCDRCGKAMVLRKSARGEFWGCSGFPKCRNIKQVSG